MPAMGMTIENMLPHCGICGDRHDGKCHPSSFEYYQCTKCKTLHWMPFDAAMMGLNGIYCGCEAHAKDEWRNIEYSEFEALKKKEPE